MQFENVNFPDAYATWTYEEPTNHPHAEDYVVLIFDTDKNFTLRYDGVFGLETHIGRLARNGQWNTSGEAPPEIKGANGFVSFDGDGILSGSWGQRGQWGKLVIELGEPISTIN